MDIYWLAQKSIFLPPRPIFVYKNFPSLPSTFREKFREGSGVDVRAPLHPGCWPLLQENHGGHDLEGLLGLGQAKS